MKHPEWTDPELIHALKGTETMRDRGWRYILHGTDWRTSVLKFVLKNNGSPDDAAEVFQNTAFSFDKNIRLGEFKKNSSLKTYFLGIAKNKWLRVLRDRARHQRHEENIAQALEREIKVGDRNKEDEFEAKDQDAYLLKIVAHVGERCKKIMQMFAQDFDMEEIAREVGLTGGADAAKREKYRCRQRILRQIADNPEWKNHI